MSKFCGSCGSQIADEATFCPNCGASAANAPAPTPAPAATQQTPYVQPTAAPAQKNNNSKVIGIAIVGVVVLVLLFVLFGSLFGGGYKKPIDNYIKGLEKADWKTFSKSLPKEQKETIEDNFDGEEFLEEMLESLEDEYGEKIKITYKITDKSKLSKKKIEDFEEVYEDVYDEEIKISKAYKIKVKVTIKGKDDKETNKVSFVVGKIKGKWYMLDSGDLG